MTYIFCKCSSLTSIILPNFTNTISTYMDYMFYECSSLPFMNFKNLTRIVRGMKYMFYGCSSLTSVDLSNLNPEQSTSMEYLFYNCPNLTYIDISSFSFNSFYVNNFFDKKIISSGTIKLNCILENKIKEYFSSNWEFICINNNYLNHFIKYIFS